MKTILALLTITVSALLLSQAAYARSSWYYYQLKVENTRTQQAVVEFTEHYCEFGKGTMKVDGEQQAVSRWVFHLCGQREVTHNVFVGGEYYGQVVIHFGEKGGIQIKEMPEPGHELRAQAYVEIETAKVTLRIEH